MTRTIDISLCLFLAAGAVSVYGQAALSDARTAAPIPARAELAAGYNRFQPYGDTAGCNCAMNGGFVSAGYRPGKGIVEWVADVSGTHGGNLDNKGLDMRLLIYTAGVRFSLPSPARRARFFAEGLFGGAHASGTFLTGIAGNSCSADSTAFKAGGGIDLSLSRRFSWRLADASYTRTDFQTGPYGYQGNLRLDTGIVIHFGLRPALSVAQNGFATPSATRP